MVATGSGGKVSSSLNEALRGRNSGRIPIWLMRQAGRYLPEYQALRKNHDFREMSHTPKLIAETTLQPLKRYDMDAAILFSDILTCLEFMGAAFKFGDEGPVLKDAGLKVLERLTRLEPEKDMSFVGEGIGRTLEGLGSKPLIGFVGAPFTLLSYLIEGGTSREFNRTRRAILEHPQLVENALDILTDSIGDYLVYQVNCGVKAVQIFDSWVGFLGVETYQQWCLPQLSRLVKLVQTQTGKPVIAYAQPTRHLIASLALSGADAMSVDWRTPLSEVARSLQGPGGAMAIQGNLDPLVLTLPWEKALPHVERVAHDALIAGLRPRWIFNVGHGVTPETRPETVEKLVEYIHSL